jgi:anthranilate synthase component 1
MAALLHPKTKIKSSKDPLAGFVLPSAILAFDHLKSKMMFFSVLPEPEQRALAREVRGCLESRIPHLHPGKSTLPLSNISEEEFSRLVARAREYIAAGDIYQVVLSMQFQGKTEVHPFQMYRALRMINPSPYMFYFNLKDEL